MLSSLLLVLSVVHAAAAAMPAENLPPNPRPFTAGRAMELYDFLGHVDNVANGHHMPQFETPSNTTAPSSRRHRTRQAPHGAKTGTPVNGATETPTLDPSAEPTVRPTEKPSSVDLSGTWAPSERPTHWPTLRPTCMRICAQYVHVCSMKSLFNLAVRLTHTCVNLAVSPSPQPSPLPTVLPSKTPTEPPTRAQTVPPTREAVPPAPPSFYPMSDFPSRLPSKPLTPACRYALTHSRTHASTVTPACPRAHAHAPSLKPARMPACPHARPPARMCTHTHGHGHEHSCARAHACTAQVPSEAPVPTKTPTNKPSAAPSITPTSRPTFAGTMPYATCVCTPISMRPYACALMRTHMGGIHACMRGTATIG